MVIAEFIGRDGSMGFKKGKRYQIHTVCKNNHIYVLEEHVLWCPYQSVEAILRNWKIYGVKGGD